jgi:alpha-N-acetylglucosaminidase
MDIVKDRVRYSEYILQAIYSSGSNFILALLVSSVFICCHQKEDVQSTDENIEPAYQVLGRLIGDRAHELVLTLAENTTQDEVTISAVNHKVTIEGNSIPAICYGAYTYLRKIGALHVSWEGNRVQLPQQWPEYSAQTLKTPFVFRQYLNVCAFGYTTVWWNWERWEREIDWMAIRSINMPSAMEGQEAVYLRLWKEMGLEESEILNHFSGAAFLPWHRMGNINKYGGPLPLSFIQKKEALQKKILNRMRDLGMKPVVPAFSGYVPESLKKKFPRANIKQLQPWEKGFEGTYLLDPKDSLFLQIGKRFIEIYQDIYGDASFYLADSFNEMKPPVTADNKQQTLAEYGEAIYRSIQQADSSATWVMQGWLFGNDQEFWDTTSIQSFLSKVPPSKMIIQDFGNDRYPGLWKQTKAYGGKQWTYGYVHNYGGSNPVYGDLEFYNKEATDLISSSEKRNLVGYGVLPEGLNNNSLVYEYIYDLPWSSQGIVWNDWISQYTQGRYGYTSDTILSAWNELKESVFQTRYWTPRWWNGGGAYLLFKRPTANIVDFEGYPGDAKKLKKALHILVKEAKANKENTLLIHDLVEFSRHYVSMHADSLLMASIRTYKSGNYVKGDSLMNTAFLLAGRLDSLIGIQPLNNLSLWLNDAKQYGDNEAESTLYINNARTQITIWGGDNLKDYASKSWQGMYIDFYVPRWRIFMRDFREALVEKKPFNEEATRLKIKAWEENWCQLKTVPSKIMVDNPGERVSELLR